MATSSTVDRFRYLPLLGVLLAASASAQGLRMGNTAFAPYGGHANVRGIVQTDIDLVNPANASGLLQSAYFSWSAAPCPGAVKIKVFRRQGVNLAFVDERGPFDVAAPQNSVEFPSLAVQQGDLIGITRLTECGRMQTDDAPPNRPRHLAFAGDLTSDVPVSAGEAGSGSIDVSGMGEALEWVVATIPVVGSSPGNFGSFFKTGLQISNPETAPTGGKLVFRPAGVPGSAADPRFEFTVGPRSTIAFEDVVQRMGQTGLGSLDIVHTNQTILGNPIPVARVFNDAGAGGTTGFGEDAIWFETGVFRYESDSRLITPGSYGVLNGPADQTRFRYNIGIRTLYEGAEIRLRALDANGIEVLTVERTLDPNLLPAAGG